jgi:uncharacterized protein DUF4389
MNTLAAKLQYVERSPVRVSVEPALGNRNRITTAFRLLLGIPHLLLVGAPIAVGLLVWWRSNSAFSLAAAAGLLGAVAAVAAVIAWVAILFTRQHPKGLWNLAANYLRWRVHAIAYLALLRDEYPPFGEDNYPARLELAPPKAERDLLTVGLRFFIVLPHLLVLWFLGIFWAVTSVIAWFAILITGKYPDYLYGFALGMVRWSVRVEAYMLLLRDEYPPFAFEEEM